MSRDATHVLVVSCAALLIGAQALTAQSPGKTLPVFVDGQAQIVPGFHDSTQWIHQELWVETDFDTDGDGHKDRMHVDVTRPRQTDTEGLRVPVVYESSPYFSGTSGERKYLWDVKQEVGAAPPPRTSQPPPPFRAVHPRISNSRGGDLGSARFRRGPLRSARHRAFAGMSHGRRRAGRACTQGRDRLAERTSAWLHHRDRQHRGQGTVVDRQGRHDGDLVRRHAANRRGDHRSKGARSDHPDLAQHRLLPVLSQQRTGASPRRLARRGRRFSLRLHSLAAVL